MISRKEIDEDIKKTTLLIKKNHSDKIKLIFEIYDLSEAIFECGSNFFVNGITVPPHDYNRHSICFASLYKGLLGLNNAIDSTLQGRVGLALLSLRGRLWNI